ncbi:MAG TPA: sensor histidine kinase [Steroidobacteraceae bacterium]|nr:sensor histidine kinase [Steroidobacteraceae bacterium]
MSASPDVAAQLHALSLHLGQRREQLLRRWREAVQRDPELAPTASLPRSELDDHFPKILEDFEHRLRADHALQAMRVDLQQRRDAAEHGSHRWQQGYDIRETLREWGHLQGVIARELDAYATAHPQADYAVTRMAREILEALCMEGIRESASRYVRLQQCEAASRVHDLEASLTALQALENERAALLRDAAHDLRGSVSMIASTSAQLARPTIQQPQREQFHDLLQQRVRSMGSLLTDLVELARLEAGQDPPRIETFDASERVREFCETLRPMATERSLFLKYEGPGKLPVQGDVLKLQRIIQCLLLNALKTTEHGGIVVRWSSDTRHPARQWTLSVSGAGHAPDRGSAGPLQQALKSATDMAHDPRLRSVRELTVVADSDTATARGEASETPPALPSGEGVRLSLVKRLCEALHATLELDTRPETGTTLRVSLPLRYAGMPPLDEGPEARSD